MQFKILCFFWLMSIAISAQTSNYEIFDLKNSVQIKTRNAPTWKPANKGLPVGLTDSIHIAAGSSIRILDTRTNEVFRSNAIGYFRIKDIRDAAQKQSANMLGAVFAQIANDGSVSEGGMKLSGATYRGQAEDIEESIATSIIHIGHLLGNHSLEYSSQITMEGHTIDGEVYFSISNKSEKDYCVNIILYNMSSKRASLCYVLNPTYSEYPYIILPHKRTIDLPMWKFTPPAKDEKYIVFATEHTYDTAHLQHILKRRDWDSVQESIYKNYIVTDTYK